MALRVKASESCGWYRYELTSKGSWKPSMCLTSAKYRNEQPIRGCFDRCVIGRLFASLGR